MTRRTVFGFSHRQTRRGRTLRRCSGGVGSSWSATVERSKLRHQRESRGRIRWLTSEELAAFREHCPVEWWPLFGLLFGTGMTMSEAIGLRRADLNLCARRVSVHEEYGRKLKRESRSRELLIPETLVPTLDLWLKGRPREPDAAVFAFMYWPARKAWNLVCAAAEICGATIHDARHTYAVHAVQDGIPEARGSEISRWRA